MPQYSLVGMQMIHVASAFATAAHSAIDQRRKYTGDVYIVHPKAVADIVCCVRNHTWQMVCAAWLHDVVEDTKVQHEVIRDVFGDEVEELVRWLTNVDQSAGNRAMRFEMNLQRLRIASPEAKTIKIADLMDNTKSIVRHDPKFASVYLYEKKELLDRALRDGDKVLWNMAMDQCERELKVIADKAERELRASI